MPNIFLKNTTASTITVAGFTVHHIDSTDAEIVEVETSQHVKYNAFKYLLNGTPYWYVIDGAHDTWTDDLSAWGYSEVPSVVLPTVTVTTEWVKQDKSATSLQNTYRNAVYDNNGLHFPYSSQFTYAPIKWFVSEQDTSGNSALNTALSNFPSYPDYLYITNNNGYTITIQRIQFAVCSDSTATVVTVYDSSNVAYNAFKFTANGTDYYYVLDGTQTDWTDDLASIGYHDYLEVTLYMPGGSSNKKNCQPNVTSGYTGQPDANYLYGIFADSSCTQTFNYDATKRYERGWYSNGEWNVASPQSIADMPSTTVSSGGKQDFILVSSGGVAKAWFISNRTTSSYVSYPDENPVSIIYRIYSL